MKLYVASSWRNKYQPAVVTDLRVAGHEVYDFRNPPFVQTGFSWREIDPNWLSWTPKQYREALRHRHSARGFASDFAGMQDAEGCVCVLPCGRSAHLEAGWFCGKDRPTWFYLPEPVEPELMVMLSIHGPDAIVTSMDELLAVLR